MMLIFRRIALVVLGIAVVIITTGIAIRIVSEGYFFIHFSFNSRFRWKQFTNPPNEPVEILAYRYPDVIIQSASGDVFSCNTNSQGCGDTPIQSFRAPSTGELDRRFQPEHSLPAPQLPSSVVDMKEYAFSWADGSTYHKIAITDDGSVWFAGSG